MAKNSPKKMRNTDPQIQKAVYTKKTNKKAYVTFYNLVRQDQ